MRACHKYKKLLVSLTTIMFVCLSLIAAQTHAKICGYDKHEHNGKTCILSVQTNDDDGYVALPADDMVFITPIICFVEFSYYETTPKHRLPSHSITHKPRAPPV